MSEPPSEDRAAADEPADDGWLPVVSVSSSAELREVLELLVAARIPVRPLAEPAHGGYAVLVPPDEVEVAAGVVDHFLVEHQGETAHDEIVAELEAHAAEESDPERAARARDRARRERRQARLLVVLVLLAAVGYVVGLAL